LENQLLGVNNMLTLKHVSKSYELGKASVDVLKGLDFQINEGDVIVIRGPSGSGKSTLLNLLGLLDSPSSGQVLLDGQMIAYDDFDKLAQQRANAISFIFQSFNLNPVLTAEENVMVPLMIRNDLERSIKQQRVDEWIRKVDLAAHRHKKPDELSGGQRQRVAIARAMVSEPRLVIADEPTANLDSKTARIILELMRNLNQERGTAFVFATHDPTLDEFAKTRLRMVDGQLEKEGSSKQ
jgi:putative ABC transport system ATP-binding protein